MISPSSGARVAAILKQVSRPEMVANIDRRTLSDAKQDQAG
jgi:hypothetical protein